MIYESAHAKINLFLDVTARRPDGYHELHSCMQTVGLSDTLTGDISFDTAERHIEVRTSSDLLPSDSRNLAYRAAEMYMEAAGIGAYSVKLHIEKRIPLSAGLGGGSADAAAVLRMLNRVSPAPLSAEALSALGARLGSDVPFCITGGTCRCLGVGEQLTPVSTRPDYTVLIAKDGDGVSTPDAFRLLDDRYGDFTAYNPRDPEAIYSALSSGNVHAMADSAYNIFEEVIFPIRPRAKELKDFLLRHGALCAQMSGSGPSVFGIFISDARAEVCAATLRQKGVFAAVCRTMG